MAEPRADSDELLNQLILLFKSKINESEETHKKRTNKLFSLIDEKVAKNKNFKNQKNYIELLKYFISLLTDDEEAGDDEEENRNTNGDVNDEPIPSTSTATIVQVIPTNEVYRDMFDEFINELRYNLFGRIVCANRTNAKRLARKLPLLYKRRSQLYKKITKLSNAETSLEDEENSAFLQEERLQKELLVIQKKICELEGKNFLFGRSMEKDFNFKDSKYPTINEEINTLIRRRPKFSKRSDRVFMPDSSDIHKIIDKRNTEDNLGIKDVDTLTKSILTKLGEMFHRRRSKDLWYDLNSFADVDDISSGFINLDDDVDKKIKYNQENFTKSVDSIIVKYTSKSNENQNVENNDNDDDDDDEEEEEQEEEDDNDDEEILPVESNGDNMSSIATENDNETKGEKRSLDSSEQETKKIKLNKTDIKEAKEDSSVEEESDEDI